MAARPAQQKGAPHPGRRRKVITAVVATGVAGIIGMGTWWWVDNAHAADATPAAASAPAVVTSPVTKQNLVDTRTVSCSLGYGKATALPAGGEGTLTWMPGVGDVVGLGKALYSLDNVPVVALPGPTPAWRDLGPGSKGPDVTQLKSALAQLGYATAQELGTTEKWTPALTKAVKAMQKATGQPVTGAVPFGSVVFLGSGIRVDSQQAVLGAKVSPGESVYSWTTPARTMGCALKAADRGHVQPGAQVPVEFADGTRVTGTLTQVTSEPNGAAGGEGDGGTPDGLRATVEVPADQVAGQLDGASARVRLEKVLASGATTVPVTALVAFADGGFGVQRQRPDGTLEYVPVSTGVFADTWVQITQGDLQPGDRVVVTP